MQVWEEFSRDIMMPYFWRHVGLGRSQHTPPTDVEQGNPPQAPQAPLDQFPKGFPSLTAFISSNAKSESFIFKRFDYLAARNLLYLQSELAFLQHRLQQFDKADYKAKGDSGQEARDCARSWEEFERKRNSNDAQRERWELVHRIRETLREYQKTLLRQSQTAALETPSHKVLEAFNREFYDNNSAIVGRGKHIYEDKGSNIQDLAQLHSTERKDRVSTFLLKYMFNWLQAKTMTEQNRRNPRISYIHARRLDLVVDMFFAFLSIFLLLGGILSLYFVENSSWRIAVIVMFTLTFAMCAIFLADGKRLAVFAACAAYAAILVVFVSGNQTPGVATKETAR